MPWNNPKKFRAEARQSREAWERARTIAAILIQPHVKKGNKVTPQQLISLPWDKKQKHRTGKPTELTAEEKRKRFEEVARRLGDEINN